MTLRFFRRKATSAATPAEQIAPDQRPPAAPEPSPLKRPTRRRRGGARSSSRSGGSARSASAEKAAASGAPSEKAAAPGAPSERAAAGTPSGGGARSGGRSRRGRSRKAAPAPAEAPPTGALEAAPAPAEAPPTGALEAAPVIPLRAEPETLGTLLAHQEAVLERLTEQQVSAFKGLQSTLSAIENRLAGMNRLTGERPRVGIFVDVPNVMYAAERLRVSIDFGKLLEFIVGDRELMRASAYAPISDDPEAQLETQKFVQPFVGLGYRIVTKPLKRYADGSTKANFDVELAIDVLTMSDRLDIVSLVSGDGDFRRLVELVASKGVRVEVVAFSQSMAAELRAVADRYSDLNEHLSELRQK